MKSRFRYTGIRVRDLDAAVEFFTKVLGMHLEGRIKSRWTKGQFANLTTAEGEHWLEVNWYPDDGPIAAPFHEGEELDHLGFEVEDFEGALAELRALGYTPKWEPYHVGRWHVAFVPVVEGLWLDVFHRDRPKPKEASRRAKGQRGSRHRKSPAART